MLPNLNFTQNTICAMELLALAPNQNTNVFWCINSNLLPMKKLKSTVSMTTEVKLRTRRYRFNLCGIKI